MKIISNIKKTVSCVLVVLVSILFFSGCQDDSYLYDGGKAKAQYDGSVLDFLKSRPDYFRQLTEIIDYAGMGDIFDKEQITFFAPTDFSIKKSMDLLNTYQHLLGRDSVTSIRQIKPQVWKDLLTLYIVKDKYLAKDIPQIDTAAMDAYPGQAYVSYNGRSMNIGVVYNEANGIKYAGYRQLLYSYVNDFADKDMTNAYVATSDIQPNNGVVHVIRFIDHMFGFNRFDFVTKAMAAGIESQSAN